MKMQVSISPEDLKKLVEKEIGLRFNQNIWRITDTTYPYLNVTVMLTDEPEVKLEEFGNVEHDEAADNANP